jgi:hypothetical protein
VRVASGVAGAVQSPGGYSATPSAAGGVGSATPAGPGYSVPPETDVDPAGDATARFTPTDSNTQRDQMPSEFGARGTGAAGNTTEGGGSLR